MNDENEILRIHENWIGFEKSGNEQGVLKLCTEDVVWLVPGMGMLQGVDEVRSFLNGQPGATIVSIDTFDIAVEVADKLAVKRANFCTRFVENGVELSVTGTHIWTLRKDSQTACWRVASVAWVIAPEPS